MADVQLVAWALSAAAVVKVADALLRDQQDTWIVFAWGLAVVAALIGRPGAMVAAACAFAVAFDGGSNHIVLYGWIALILAVVPHERIGETFRVLGVTVYAFATVHKLIGGTFLTGVPIAARSGLEAPLTVLMAYGAIIAQVWLVVALWRRHWTALPFAVALHVGIIAVMSAEWLHVLQLGVFNGLMVLVVWLGGAKVFNQNISRLFSVGPHDN